MTKLTIILCASLFMANVSYSQDKVGDMIALTEVPESIALMEQASTYTKAIVNADFDKVASLTHDDIIAMGGGVDFLIKDLDAEGKGLAAQGMVYDSVELGNHPEFLTSDEELQTILPVKFHLLMNAKKVESWVNLFASSSDEGKSWKFVNLEKFDEPSLRAFVKNVSPELVYPQR